MNLKLLLPFQVFAEKIGVTRIVAETREGSFGLLPHRLDCVVFSVHAPRWLEAGRFTTENLAQQSRNQK